MNLSAMFLLNAQLEKNQTYIQKTVDEMVDKITAYGGRFLVAIVFIIIGLKVVKWITKLIRKSFDRHQLEASVKTFLVSLISIILKILVFLTGASIMGFQMTSFVTILGSAGLAISLSLQGSLANFAGGVLILLLKPFVVGDYIVAQDGEGTVASIDIFYTRLRTADNQIVIIPNGGLSNNALTNVTKEDFRRVDLMVDIAYDEDIRRARDIIMKVLDEDEAVLSEKEKVVYVNELAASGVNLGIRAWVSVDKYWQAKWRILENVKYSLDEGQISIPYTTVDINLKNS